MKTLIINGSPRKNGDTTSLINILTEQLNGEYKIIDVEGYGLRSVGHGIVLEYNADRFSAHGINVANYPLGSTLPVSIVDAVELE